MNRNGQQRQDAGGTIRGSQPGAGCSFILASSLVIASVLAGGCAPRPVTSPADLRGLAQRYVTRAATYRENPLLRAQAIESLQKLDGERAVTWFREALRDDAPGVRFAALMALGAIRHKPSETVIRLRLADADPSVRVAAMYALRRLGDPGFVKEFDEIVRLNPDPAVRRNAILALGRLEESGAIVVLKKAKEDKDDSVRLQAFEAMAMLGDKQALQELTYYASGGLGDRQAFALEALGRAGDAACASILQACLKDAPHLESRLAAAQSLGLLGFEDGFALAMAALHWNNPNPRLQNDPPRNQIMRVRTMAAFALGAIGKPEALNPLRARMEDSADPRTQLAAATAILQVLHKQQAPFGEPAPAESRPLVGPGPASDHQARP